MTDLYDRITCINRGYADYKAGVSFQRCPYYNKSFSEGDRIKESFWAIGWKDAEREAKNEKVSDQG